MTSWEAFQIYTALKLHFSSGDYDAVKYNFHVNAKAKNFAERKDRFYFERLGKKYPDRENLIDFLVANFVARNSLKSAWIDTFLTIDAEINYLQWRKKIEAISHFMTDQIEIFENHRKKLGLSFDEMFKSVNGEWPPIVKLYNEGALELETVAIFDKFFDFMKDAKVTETIFWPEFHSNVYKYSAFLRKLNYEKLRQVILKSCTDIRK